MCEYRKCALNNEGSCQMVREGGCPARRAYEDGIWNFIEWMVEERILLDCVSCPRVHQCNTTCATYWFNEYEAAVGGKHD